MSNESAFKVPLNYKSIKVGEMEIDGKNVFSIEPPSRGRPYWMIFHADDYDEREQVTIAANIPVLVEAERDTETVDEEEVQIDE